MKKESFINNVRMRWLYFIELILLVSWLTYLSSFYSFYKEAYFYVDKRLSLLLQLLSLFNNEWNHLFLYFVLGFILMVVILFFTGLTYMLEKRTRLYKHYSVWLFLVTLFCFLPLFFTICGGIFFTLVILAASLVYAIFILGAKEIIGGYEAVRHFQEGDTIEVKGPFETEEEALKNIDPFLSQYLQDETLILEKEIYLGTDHKYYVDIYIETIKK